MANPNKRMSDNEWLKVLQQLRNQTILCGCGNETFVELGTDAFCFNCRKTLGKPLTLSVDKQQIVLYPNMRFYANQTSTKDDAFTATGEVIRSAKNPSVWGIVNRTQDTWNCTFPDGRKVEIESGKGFPIFKGMSVHFSSNKIGKIN